MAYRCIDCGSIFPKNHTILCELAPTRSSRTLRAVEGTQWWDKTEYRLTAKEQQKSSEMAPKNG